MLLRPKSDFPSVKLYRRRTAAIVLLRTREVSSMEPPKRLSLEHVAPQAGSQG